MMFLLRKFLQNACLSVSIFTSEGHNSAIFGISLWNLICYVTSGDEKVQTYYLNTYMKYLFSTGCRRICRS